MGAAIALMGFKVSAWGSEPLMDSDIFKGSRLESYHFTKDGFFTDAVKAEEKALRIALAQWGPLHSSLIPIYRDLGILYHTLAEYPKAERTYKWGLALAEKNLGSDDPRAADFLDSLASLYMDLDRKTEALFLEERSLEIREAHQDNTPAYIQTLGSLGIIESSLDHNVQAQSYLKRALVLLEKMNNADVGPPLHLINALADSYRSEKNTAQEQATLEKALGLARKAFPADSAEVADALSRLGDFFRDQKQEDKAKPLYDSAVLIDRHFVGTDYSYASLPFLKRLANADFATGQFKEAEFLWKKSIQVEKEVFGARHPKVALDLIHLADAQSALNQKSKSQESLKESLNLLKDNFPEDSPWIRLIQKRLK